MKIHLDDNLLRDLFVNGLPLEQRQKLLDDIYETLEQRVIKRIVADLTPEQLSEFEKRIDSGKEEETMEWVTKIVPEYKNIVQAEFSELKKEIQSTSEFLLR